VASGSVIDELIHFDLRQSMRNGGGPACLRLRVALTDAEAAAMHQGVVMTETLYHTLVAWVEKHYRDRLEPADLADPQLAIEVHTALEELSRILGLPGCMINTPRSHKPARRLQHKIPITYWRSTMKQTPQDLRKQTLDLVNANKPASEVAALISAWLGLSTMKTWRAPRPIAWRRFCGTVSLKLPSAPAAARKSPSCATTMAAAAKPPRC
jgi:hypothetical protein